jgi:hypothetical protein
MRDALANMQKLPSFCYAVMNDEAVQIRLGAREAFPMPGLARDRVVFENQKLGVTDAQQLAMIAGVTFGWDADAADPDEHTRVTDPEAPVGPFAYEYAGDIEVTITVTAPTEEAAAAMVRERLQSISDNLLTFAEDVTCAPSETIDLVDSNDPRET